MSQSTTIEKRDHQDRSTQQDVVAATSASTRKTSQGLRTSTETPGGQTVTSAELPWIGFTVEFVVNISAPCEIKPYL